MHRLLAVLLLLASPATAQDMLDGPAFEAFTTGRIFAFAHKGQPPYGTEHYLPDRQVYWIDNAGQCHRGEWFVDGDDICFRYRSHTGLTCSQFATDGRALIVFPTNPPSDVHRATPTGTMLPSQCEAPLS